MPKPVYFEDLVVGEALWGDEVFVDPEEMMDYNRRNDPWRIHVDPDFAARSPFGSVIASGGFSITLLYRSMTSIYNNERQAWEFLGGLSWDLKFSAPVRPGDRMRSRVTVESKRLSSKPGRGVVNNRLELCHQDGSAALAIDGVFLIATRPTEA